MRITERKTDICVLRYRWNVFRMTCAEMLARFQGLCNLEIWICDEIIWDSNKCGSYCMNWHIYSNPWLARHPQTYKDLPDECPLLLSHIRKNKNTINVLHANIAAERYGWHCKIGTTFISNAYYNTFENMYLWKTSIKACELMQPTPVQEMQHPKVAIHITSIISRVIGKISCDNLWQLIA